MSARRPDEAARAVQREAARPDRSVVLRASAGAGKTRVLVDRIVRLLLAGADPKGIVALTFTRKAAVEIQQRLQQRLARYATLAPADLRGELADLLGRPPSPAETERAGRLAERLLEDPTGLLIGTIHTFCQTLLARFADEAGLDPRFSILEPVDELWDEAVAALERETAGDAVATDRWAGALGSPDQARKLLGSFLDHRLELDRWIARVRPDLDPLRDGRLPARHALAADLAAVLVPELQEADGTVPDPAAVARRLATAAETACRELAETGIASVRDAGDGTSDALDRHLDGITAAARAAARDLAAGGAFPDTLAILRERVFTKKGELRQLKGPKKAQAARQAALAGAVAPLVAVLRSWERYQAWRRHRDLLGFGLRALDLYDDLKRRDRCLDFHDLEWLATRLLTRDELGPWLQYRLDAALEHLLVDEFQDTNRNQWELLSPLAREFLAGEGRTDRPRTVFLVGDVKQSIYRFRGARPELFAEVAAELDRRAAVPSLTLPTNFRSLPAVVETVGDLFTGHPLRDHLPEEERERETARQLPFRDEAPGAVHLLRPEPAGQAARDREADRIVRILRRLEATGRVIDPGNGHPRPVRWSDVLLLVRSRGHADRYEQALREAGIPHVPAGRGALAATREVQDLLALLRWLLLPDDDAVLAAVLRSPLFRLPEPRLQELLEDRKRGQTLWQALRLAAGEGPDDDPVAVAARLLADWLGRVEQESPHALLRRIYRDTDAVIRYELALGEQAAYNLWRLCDLALAHEEQPYSSLRSLAAAVERAAVTASEEEAPLPERGEGRVQILTIHGAKGLEAPVVLLADSAAPFRLDADLLDLGGRDTGPLYWPALDPAHRRLLAPDGEGIVAGARTRHETLAMREEANLLYVALTRARDECWSTGTAPDPKRDGNKPSHARWLEAAGALEEPPDWSATGGADDDASPLPGAAAGADGPAVASLFETWTPPVLAPRLETVTPSARAAAAHAAGDAGEPPALPADPEAAAALDDAGADAVAAADRGIRIHRWLQVALETGTPPPVADDADAEAAAVHANPDLAWLFREPAERLAEAPVLARLPGGPPERRLLGVVDCLVVTGDTVHVVDWKTGRAGADDPRTLAEAYRPQLEAYRQALAPIYPGRTVRCWIVATAARGPGGQGVAVELAPAAPEDAGA